MPASCRLDLFIYSDQYFLRSLSVYSLNYKEWEINKKKGGSWVMDQAHCALCRGFLIASDSFMKAWLVPLLYRGRRKQPSEEPVCPQWEICSGRLPAYCNTEASRTASLPCHAAVHTGLADKFNFTLSLEHLPVLFCRAAIELDSSESLKSGHTTPLCCGPQWNTIPSRPAQDGGKWTRDRMIFDCVTES